MRFYIKTILLFLNLVPRTLSLFDLEVHETSKVPSYFINIGPANISQILNLEVVLHSRDIQGLETALYRVSSPASQDYGQHLTKEEVNHYFRPSWHGRIQVMSWLKSHGIFPKVHTSTGLVFRFSTTVAAANRIFFANFSEYLNAETNESVIRTITYSLPKSISPFISHVHPAVVFPLPQRKSRRQKREASALKIDRTHNNAFSDCLGSYLTISCIGALYGIPQNESMHSNNPYQLSVFGMGNTIPSSENLQAFLKLYREDLVATNMSYAYFPMDSSASHAHPVSSPEADLDVEYTVSMTGIPVMYAANSDATVNAFLTTALTLLDMPHPPSVLSISYGADEYFVGMPLARSICNAFMALGVRGVSILAASGDGGVSGIQYDPSCLYYQPTFPASCPFLTSVGGTMISNDTHEIAANLSSGGFSSIFLRPSYQNDAVNHFLEKSNKSNSAMYISTNRAFPDTAAIAENIALVDSHGLDVGGGTSFAAPIMASVIALINAQRVRNNKSTLGFLNPSLYANNGSFFDVMAGSNPGCGTDGFSAVEGWDPVTGLGTPDFPEMLKILG